VLLNLLAELFAVLGAEPTDRGTVDATILATRIIMVHHVVCRVFLVDTGAVSAFYHVDAIAFAIK
jgi:hypothetical protein